MAGNTFGQLFRISTFVESHGVAIGVILDGCPAQLPIDLEFIQSELDKRRPGQSKITTQRKESDTVQVLSGIFEGKSTGTPIALLIPNRPIIPIPSRNATRKDRVKIKRDLMVRFLSVLTCIIQRENLLFVVLIRGCKYTCMSRK